MLNRIIRFSLYNRLTVLVLWGLALIYGAYVLMRSDVDIFPDLNAPTVVVMTEAPGMAPEEVERGITYPIETAVNGAEGVRRVRSSSSTGFSTVWVEFDWDSDVYRARQIVSERLSGLASSLPPGAGIPTLGPQSSILGEMLIIGLTADSLTNGRQLRDIADREIVPLLQSESGVASVAVIGGEAKEYQIRLLPAAMQTMGVSLGQAAEALEGMTANVTGGVLYEYGNEYLVKGSLATVDLDDIAQAVVGVSPQGQPVRLDDIAEIAVGGAEPRLGAASVAGESAVLITVTKQPGAPTIDLTARILKRLDALRPNLPADVTVRTDIFRQADFIDTSISNLQESLFIGAVLVIAVIFFFLLNLRTTVISLVALPLSIIVTVIVLHALGLTLNTMSLGGIAIAIGSLVDDAIVDVENVYKRLRERRATGEKVIKIVYDASREVRMPIFNSSLIILASFMPLFFLTGMEGRMLRPLGISFIVALLASTVVALTVTPVLCSFLLGSEKAQNALSREPRFVVWLRKVYMRALGAVLSHGRTAIIVCAVLFAGAVATFFTLGRSFLPPFNEGSLTINVSTLPGISLDQSDRLGREAEKIILETPEISVTARKTGRAELDEHSLGVNVSEIEAPYTLDKGRTRKEMIADLRDRLSHLPGVVIEIGQPVSHRIDAMLSGTEAQIAVKLFGPDLNTLYANGKEIGEVMETVPGVVDVNIEQQVERPRIDIKPRREMMAYYGVTPADFARDIQVALAGVTVSQVFEDGFPYDVTLRLHPSSRSSIEDISMLPIETSRGMVPLSTVAEVVSTVGPNTINRENVSRRLVISANVADRDLKGAVDEIRAKVAEDVKLPAGYRVEYGGQFESEARASSTLLLVSLLALLVIFMLLYGEYRNVALPLIILVNMPLAVIGGIFILRCTSGELNIPAIIGFISLMGISTRNGMLLVSRFEALRRAGKDLADVIRIGSTDRLNPILMTALSTSLALIPLAVGGDLPGNEIQSPLAVVILGGLLTSTLLNIFIVPVLYRSWAKSLIHKNA